MRLTHGQQIALS